MAARISAPRSDLQGLSELEPLWKELHRHHLEVSGHRRLVHDLDSSWAQRLAWYRRLLGSGGLYLTATDDQRRLIGYAMVALEDGPDDTFEIKGGVAEVITLIVADRHRSGGVGQSLLHAAENIARAIGFDTVKVAVMSGNERARNFYEASGYAVAEQVLYRHLSER